jgi:hypothetical protein
MVIIPQKRLLGWEEIDKVGDLQRLQLVLESLPDDRLMKVLEEERERGRNEQLRQICGFEVERWAEAIPASWCSASD